MMRLRQFLVATMIVLGSVGLLSVTTVTPAYAATCKDTRFLTLPAWYKGLSCTSDGSIVSPQGEEETQKFITQIVLNVIDILIQIAGYTCVAFIIVGGFRYITSGGSPNGMAAALKTILNAIIGLAIALFAVVIVNLIGATL